MGKFGKKNHVSVNLLDYSTCLLGEAKVGKTTLIKEVCEKLAGEDGYLFLEFGDERGAAAIENINYENVEAWWSDEDEDIVGFADIVEDICENKTTDYPDLKVVVWDTYDQIIPIAEAESIRLYNKSVAADKRAETINSAWGGFGRGEKKAMELMWDMKNRLKKVGVETIIIGHVKTKDITDTVTGEQYQILTSDQQQNYFNALKKQLHFLALAYVDREIVKEKTGRKDIKGKDVMKKSISEETRKIKFRDEGYAVDAGSRFSDIVSEIPMDADEFIKAIEDAIKAEQSKSGKSFEESKAEQEEAEAKKLKEIAEAEKAKKAQKSVDEVMNKVLDYIKANKSTMSKIKPILEKAKELGYSKPTEVDKLEDAEALLALIEE
jgi:hypothetical protein